MNMTYKKQNFSSASDNKYQYDDEIELMDYIRVLLHKKWLVIFVTSCVTVAGVFYSFTLKNSYRSEINFQPLSEADRYRYFQEILLFSSTSKSSVSDLKDIIINYDFFEKFISELESSLVRNNVYNFIYDNKNAGKKPYSYDEFDDSIKINAYDKKGKIINRPSVFFEGHDPDNVSATLNLLVQHANENVARQLFDYLINVDSYLLSQNKSVIEQNIEVLRLEAEYARLAMIEQIEEAIQVARHAGIMSNDLVHEEDLEENDGQLMIKQPLLNWNAAMPLYMFGVQHLESELNGLKSRKINDPYIERLPELKAKLALLEKNNSEMSSLLANKDLIKKIKAVTVEKKLVPSSMRVKSNRIIVIVSAFFAGLLLAIFSAFLVNFFENFKKETSNVSK